MNWVFSAFSLRRLYQGYTKRRRKIAEIFNRLSRVHERYRRQTDRRTGDSIAYSEREREFTFAKNRYRPIWPHVLRLNRPTEGFLRSPRRNMQNSYLCARDSISWERDAISWERDRDVVLGTCTCTWGLSTCRRWVVSWLITRFRNRVPGCWNRVTRIWLLGLGLGLATKIFG